MTLVVPPPVAGGETLGELFARLVEDGKRFARAEITYYREVALGRIAALKAGVALMVVAVLLIQASLTTLLVGVGLAIARLLAGLGTAGGVIFAAVLGMVLSGLLIWIAIGRLARSGDGQRGA